LILEMFDLSNIGNDKSIPSKVFFNHFDAIAKHCYSREILKLKKVNYYNRLETRNADFEIEKCKKFLWNSWSTEFSCGLAQMVDNTDYYKYSLHWNFPQAYYSVYLNMTAFHETQGLSSDAHETSIKTFGNSVKDNHYPQCVSFHAKGMHKDFTYHNLNKFDGFPDGFSSLSNNRTEKEIQTQIATFLKTTREKTAKDKREKLRPSDKRFHTAQGAFTQQFREKHWNILYGTIPVTSVLNILYRLRIKANYHDVQTFIDAEINFKSFQESLLKIVNCLNFIHEAYIAKCIGMEAYENIIDEFKKAIIKNTAIKRLEKIKEI
jgi:hypothetical protein